MAYVSIITALYNCENYLDKTVRSVLDQTVHDWELILVDDCSNDNSCVIAQRYANQDARIKLLSLDKNSGAAVARNAAINVAKGRYIAFLDSDDSWLPHKLERQIKFMEQGNIALSYSAYEKLDESGEVIGKVGVPDKVCYYDLLKVNSIGCLTAMYDTQALGKVYMPLIRKRQDLGLWLNILKKTPYAYGINEVLAQYQVRQGSISANKRSAVCYTWRLYRQIEKLNFFSASYYILFYSVNGLFRTKFPKLARIIGVLK